MIPENFTDINIQLSRLYQKQKLHHCILIEGQSGIGKNSFSVEFVKNILANNHITNLLQLDSGDKKIITIDKVRLISDFVNKSSISNCDKFIIIDSICQANIASQNAILKLLEEPNAKNFFILICHNINQILGTIKSRSYIVKCSQLNYKQFSNYLKLNSILNNENELLFLSEICQNSVGLAINEGKNLIKFYQLMIKSFSLKYLDDELVKLVAEKNFKINNFLIIYQYFALKLLKKNKNINIINIFDDDIIIADIVSKMNYNKLKFIIDDSIQMINNAIIFNLDKKTLLINIFNYLNSHD